MFEIFVALLPLPWASRNEMQGNSTLTDLIPAGLHDRGRQAAEYLVQVFDGDQVRGFDCPVFLSPGDWRKSGKRCKKGALLIVDRVMLEALLRGPALRCSCRVLEEYGFLIERCGQCRFSVHERGIWADESGFSKEVSVGSPPDSITWGSIQRIESVRSQGVLEPVCAVRLHEAGDRRYVEFLSTFPNAREVALKFIGKLRKLSTSWYEQACSLKPGEPPQVIWSRPVRRR